MKLILDTNAYAGFKLGYSELVEYIVRADVIFISPIVLGELIFGFRNGSRFSDNMKDLNLFLSHPAVETTTITDITSDRYSRIALQLKNQGTPIPSNDIWIAAQTMETGAELVTMDNHFDKVSGLVYRLFVRPPPP
ncbi:PilT protein domain protein [Desulfonatronospira thiodismutans ASO3-1]|uniref:PilT protein domain protein n=1 Tax=Desulfonatronospira thiodismutans ASO3-1 TaxID=555779 RepID=D6SKK8_9BACT|nr:MULTISPECIES: type II toxin-antitoxin system VapC family toxin [Desulfonatronospira]EFI35219.1 PilT protein domain protein [Desulfonatronospira thiodismutans ASO3-1]RQD75364.1 MAG: type II toxin-antitoxin system VapC family toxin [Desulfonatronospira sp. MSAO_Bac3]